MFDTVSRLAAIDPRTADRATLLDALAKLQRLSSWQAAFEAGVLDALQTQAEADASDPADREWLAEEVGAVLRLRGDFARGRMVTAAHLVRRLPAALAALQCGVLTPVQSRMLAEATFALDDEATTTVEQRVLVRAGDQTSGQFRRTLTRAVLAAHPRTSDDAHDEAVRGRRVEVLPADDGMAILWALLPAAEAMRLKSAIWRLGFTRRANDTATQPIEAHRADALVDLGDRYLGDSDPTGAINRQSPAVQVVVPLLTLTGDSNEPGELIGYGPIAAGLARRIAADPGGTWQRLITDPAGELIDYGRTRYRPPKQLADHVRTKHRTCVFPTCNRSAGSAELDHVQPWAEGGGTAEINLTPLCSRHHHLKHDGRWRLRRTLEGTFEWTSPSGRKYLNARN